MEPGIKLQNKKSKPNKFGNFKLDFQTHVQRLELYATIFEEWNFPKMFFA